jgi:hypothetical protein
MIFHSTWEESVVIGDVDSQVGGVKYRVYPSLMEVTRKLQFIGVILIVFDDLVRPNILGYQLLCHSLWQGYVLG